MLKNRTQISQVSGGELGAQLSADVPLNQNTLDSEKDGLLKGIQNDEERTKTAIQAVSDITVYEKPQLNTWPLVGHFDGVTVHRNKSH